MPQLQQTAKTADSHFHCPSWQSILRTNVTEPAELCEILRLPPTLVSEEAAAVQPLNVTRDYLSRMEPGNLDDPLLLQILPRHEELKNVPGFSEDPLDEASCLQQMTLASPGVSQPGKRKYKLSPPNHGCQLPMLQKYPGRLLLLTTNRCAANCRFCFRRNLLKQKTKFLTNHEFNAKLARHTADYSNAHDDISDIREIILSGGDPLMLNDDEIGSILNYIKDLHPGNRVRLHTRMPVMLPERVTPQLVELLQSFRCATTGGAVYVVLHINHPNELSYKVLNAIASFVDAGIPVLSQTVLLRHVNDHFETLFDLFEQLADSRIIPYYLYQLDRVQGAAHFEVPTVKGQVLVAKLSAALPGYAVPQYVREIPGESKKARI